MFLSKRFFPFFVTQCLGALNDNVYKNVLLLMVTYSLIDSLPVSVNLFVNLAAGLFILPFFLFSAHAGAVADSMDKAKLIRRLKLIEVLIMACAATAIMTENALLMLVLLFLTGTQSAYFGPVKYALLPQALKASELVKGNAWVEMGTFLSILVGTLTAGLLLAMPNGTLIASCLVLFLSIMGFISSVNIPALPSHSNQKVKFKPISGLKKTLNVAQKQRGIWMSILAISWFWFMGATYLTQFPNFAREHLFADSTVVSLLLALFSIGIATGSWLCQKLSFDHVELGILPFGILGLTLFGLDLLWAVPSHSLSPAQYYSVESFISESKHVRVMMDLFFVGVSGGIFIVPLYSFIQSRSNQGECARSIAANNIMNALFMVGSALVSIFVLSVLSLSVVELFAIMAVGNFFVAIYVYRQVPEFTQRFISYLLSHCMYRVSVEGRQHIPETGAALIVANHVSYVDALILMGTSTRPVRFVMDKSISEMPVLKYVFRHAGVIPICSPRKCTETYKQAFEQIEQALHNEEVVCIFPEGRLTSDGELGEFRPGVEKILKRSPVPVIPMALKGLWGSFFSHKGGHALTKRPKRFWSKIEVKIGQVLGPVQLDRHKLQQEVQELLINQK
ncbi:MFS transporter [Vibrio natriegens]|uniref:Acyl-phosphate glycerol 3-phosphate acyltransferase n=1 Tax=Vibrio natriegens NBRC 15636 = ATCC 14048 = DSM 759 TaxID=1219067 RepID=A0AAN0Y6Z5_VIBNA|nr:MFS transporter [Vibrio natriegens]ALR17836.1 acyl-phosphate glycerol 3-phosphate acyltransferase [Vibrio natriegens NBRC 15636 = ATCC 14048 = DSM 759]ANQ15328.1 acyl-phosphate glycerol 3-phosphate acyltransferase [Vibrio natriegens NBRC 15636 = ATCC 14048 = DSM 759]EPM41033.1 lysophospholipid transporter LplT/2-acylglycerophosphoethanolamine acyltransferase [Vibrio natriegens NBRC 15636 = ATCC 14048 = DSM 759]MDX6029319.1 MFS transporter [Vibrio natriegens NBRC 15636 = ATCC 14048 = DSM 759]